jgi:hypothetical protein
MFSRIINAVWRQIAQSKVCVNNLICTPVKAVYLNNQGSTYSSSMTPRLAASLAKAEANQEIFRPSKWISSFISPLLGPLCFYTRVSFYGVPHVGRAKSPTQSLKNYGVPHV